MAADDSYIAGYATAMLEQEFRLAGASLEVKNGVITINAETLGDLDLKRVSAMLKKIPGVVSVEIREGQNQPEVPDQKAVKTTIQPPQPQFLPDGILFAPLHADPRWPHLSAAYRRFINNNEFTDIFAANFGETFALYRNAAPYGGQWEVAIQAGAFTLFDEGSPSGSKDLINADYTVALMANYRSGNFSGFLRLKHQSSHLGDEYVLNNPGVTRVNLSFEEVDLKMSYEPLKWLRIYGGGGYLMRREPTTIKPLTTQFGAELMSPKTYFNGNVRPVAYADFQINERTKWSTASSLMAGIQFENARIGDRKIQFLAEYFSGPYPDGQFFTQHVQWIGAGFHLYF